MGRKIMLIADDVKMNRSVIKRFFQRDFDVLEAENGREVMAVLSNTSVDVMLLDIIMPEMNGLEVMQEIKKNPAWRDIAIFVATSAKEKTEREALSLGADDVVSKPYDPVIIKRRIENVLVKKALEKEHRMSNLDSRETEYKMEYLRNLSRELKAKIENMDCLTQIIERNTDNEELLKDCAKKLRRESQTMLKWFEEVDG